MLAETRKAWVSALLSGVMAAVAAAAQMDWTAIGPNEWRDLIVTFLLAAGAAGGITYAVPNKPTAMLSKDSIQHNVGRR